MLSDVDKPLIIAGPCSLESEIQLEQVTYALKKREVDMIRLGIWKPRTDPNSFQGIGKKGLRWLEKVNDFDKQKFAIEVATPMQVEQALEVGIRKLWIGARTTTSPFAVQEIADALRGEEVLVMVKNPINPDLKLWVGAFERLAQAGIRKVMAIHRGFQIGNEKRYRNTPLWEIAIKLSKEMPHIPMICDPSHMAGKKEYILELILYAKQLHYDGYMLEVHPNPASALSDAKQQLDFNDFKEILKVLYQENSRSFMQQCNLYRKMYLEDQIEMYYDQIYKAKNELEAIKEE